MPDPLNMTGPEFLRFYVPLVVTSIVIALALRWWLSRDSGEHMPLGDDKLSTDEVATLAAGPRGLGDSALAALVNCGAVKLAGGAFSRGGASTPKLGSSVDRVITTAIGGGDTTLRTIRKAVVESPEAKAVVTAMQDRGLLHTDSQRTLLRWAPAAMILFVLALGAGKFAVGVSRGKPVVLLMIIGIAQLAAVMYVMKSAPFRTKRGDRKLNELRTENAALEHAGARGLEAMAPREVQLATALFGAAMMAGSLATLGSLMNSPSEAYGGSTGCGSSCGGGSSCSGGGCGGCGGGGGD